MDKKDKLYKPINYYEKIPKDLLDNSFNPKFHKHHMKIPFRMIVIGSSGSGKTSTVLNIIKAFNGTFGKIVIISKNLSEPLYKFLRKEISEEDGLEMYEGLENTPALDTWNKKQNNLIIWDDMMNEKNLKSVSDYFIRCRKLNVSAIFISQSYFIPDKDWKTIRRNCNYIILKKINSTKDINLIIREYSLDITKQQFMKIYENIIKEDFSNFLLIDIDASPEERFRKNFEKININYIGW